MDGHRKSKVISAGQRSFRLVKGHLGWSTITWPEWCRLRYFAGSNSQKLNFKAVIRKSPKLKGCYLQITQIIDKQNFKNILKII